MSRNRRVLWIVADSVGVGALPDADQYGDQGAATLQNTARAVSGLKLPHLARLGLGRIVPVEGVAAVEEPSGFFGKLAARSVGKDTTTGHWEMAGRIVSQPFSLFPEGFPPQVLEPFSAATGRGVLGNKAASGTAIIEEFGREHLATGDWIVYTSADSVFQVAAHEDKIPLEELYAACRIARELLDPLRVGRVIARPFVGQPGSFERTYRRHDFSMQPDGETVLTALQQQGVPTIGVGKIRDIFAGQGVERSVTTEGNRDGLEKTRELLDSVERGLIFVNLVDFDMRYGHRRDPRGYADALEEFDAHLPQLMRRLGDEDLMWITADHGCDPTFGAHTDHTREYVPLLAYSAGRRPGADLGTRESFADLAASTAAAFGLAWRGPGRSFLDELGVD